MTEATSWKVSVLEQKTNKFLYHRYVRSTSEAGARITAEHVERRIFGKAKTIIGQAARMTQADCYDCRAGG